MIIKHSLLLFNLIFAKVASENEQERRGTCNIYKCNRYSPFNLDSLYIFYIFMSKRGQPKKLIKRDQKISIYLTEDEFKLIENATLEASMLPATFCRITVLTAVSKNIDRTKK